MSDLAQAKGAILPIAGPITEQRTGRRRTHPVRHAASMTLLWIVALLFLLPLIYTVATSLKPAADVFTSPPKLWGSQLGGATTATPWTTCPSSGSSSTASSSPSAGQW